MRFPSFVLSCAAIGVGLRDTRTCTPTPMAAELIILYWPFLVLVTQPSDAETRSVFLPPSGFQKVLCRTHELRWQSLGKMIQALNMHKSVASIHEISIAPLKHIVYGSTNPWKILTISYLRIFHIRLTSPMESGTT